MGRGGYSVLWKVTNGPASTQRRGSIVQISQYDLIFAFYSVFIAVIYPVVEVMWWAIRRASKAVFGCARKQQNTGRTVGKSLRGEKIMNYGKAIMLADAVTPLNCVWEVDGVESGNTGYPDNVFCMSFVSRSTKIPELISQIRPRPLTSMSLSFTVHRSYINCTLWTLVLLTQSFTVFIYSLFYASF